MKNYLLLFILMIVAFVPALADGYTGILVTDNNDRTTYYLFDEEPDVKYKAIDGVTNACLYTTGSTEPVVSVPLQNGAKLSVKFNIFVRVVLNSKGYATFSAKDESFIATEGITAYKAKVAEDGKTLNLTLLEGNIPAGNGILLYGETPHRKVNLPVATTGTAADLTDNSLLPTTYADGTLAEKGDNAWALGDGNLFLRYTGSAFIHNRAYLIHTTSSGARTMEMKFDDDGPTGVDSAFDNTAQGDGKYIDCSNIVIIKNGKKYNIAGQPIN